MNLTSEQVQKRTWKTFFLLQNKLFTNSYAKVLNNFSKNLKHSNKEITAILFLDCYYDNFDLILNNLEKSEKELKQENESYKQAILSSKENNEILDLTNQFIKNIKSLDTNLENLVLFAFSIITLSFIKDTKQQENIVNEFVNQWFDSDEEDRNNQEYFYKTLEKTWKENTDTIYQEFVTQENQKINSPWEKTAFISFNYFNSLFR